MKLRVSVLALGVGVLFFLFKEKESLIHCFVLSVNSFTSTTSARGIAHQCESLNGSDPSPEDGVPEQTKESPPIRIGGYPDYLDKVCPRLTEGEEDRVVTEAGYDSRVLIGLVFAQSPRTQQWLREALLRDPENPLVHYAILARSDISKSDPNFDRLRSALDLARLSPDDAAPMCAAALEAFRRGDRATAISYLKQAEQREQFSSLHEAALQSAIDVYRSAGRPESDARGRVLLQSNGQWEAATISQLSEALGVMAPDQQTLWAPGEITALVINAHQKAVNAAGFDLATYVSARTGELNYLESLVKDPTQRLSGASSASLPEMLAEARAEYDELRPFIYFAQDKAGIYARLDEQQKSEMIDRIGKEGEISAFRWASQVRPDIFSSPSFVPLGVPRDRWVQMIGTN